MSGRGGRLGLCALCSGGVVWEWAPEEEGPAGCTPPHPTLWWQACASGSPECQGQACTRNPYRPNCKNDPGLNFFLVPAAHRGGRGGGL